MFEMTRTDQEWKDKIITGDETWVYGYDPETKRQSAEWRGQGISLCGVVSEIGFCFDEKRFVTHALTFFRIYKLEYIRTFSNFSMNYIEKQRVCIEFCFKLGKTASESFQMLKQAFKEDFLSQSRTFEWFARFKAGRTSVKDDIHTGRPLSIRNPENALKIKSSIEENPRITIRELSEDLDISFGTYQTIIKNDLPLKRTPAKFVLHLLTNEQKEHRKETCKNMVEMFNSDPH
ncbi:hypothetical protein LAZ67_1007029 [Cordylochernes scorpioides]|uniref:Mos1 transposase HTH domain-containing protein n=1 Tax=Cordylochernes scorpioides TaxID=51811 RepID=A0ABY6JYZ2_9ARAC|nr:hypothetical protein LAZ67_1007029 [Cordylochernes scorpioides]